MNSHCKAMLFLNRIIIGGCLIRVNINNIGETACKARLSIAQGNALGKYATTDYALQKQKQGLCFCPSGRHLMFPRPTALP